MPNTKPVKGFPESPSLDEIGDLSGHLWIQELPTGGQFRFQVAPSGLITFGTHERTFTGVESVPFPYRRAAETISKHLDRAALTSAVENPAGVTLFGRATRNEGIDYDWTALPPFVGIDVWSPNTESLLPPDAATTIVERLGLPTLPPIEKEVPAAHTDLSRYDSATNFPASAWRDGDVAAVLIRDKAGSRAHAQRPGLSELSESASDSPADLAAQYATDARIARTIEALTEHGQTPTVDEIRTRLIADVAREAYAHLRGGNTHITSTQEFQSSVAERVQKYVQQ